MGIRASATAVGNGRDPAIFHPDPTRRLAVRQTLDVPDDRVAIVAVSRLVRHKGYPELLAAMETVPDAELWVVGERLSSDHGEDLEPYFTRAERLLGSRLKMLGYRDDVAAVLAAADIFTLPSHFEGLPMSVIEAMLTGLPVVATDIRGSREEVEQDATGLLVPAGDIRSLAAALERLVRAPQDRHAMGTAGRARALRLFSEPVIVARTAALLEQGMARVRRRARTPAGTDR